MRQEDFKGLSNEAGGLVFALEVWCKDTGRELNLIRASQKKVALEMKAKENTLTVQDIMSKKTGIYFENIKLKEQVNSPTGDGIEIPITRTEEYFYIDFKVEEVDMRIYYGKLDDWEDNIYNQKVM